MFKNVMLVSVLAMISCNTEPVSQRHQNPSPSPGLVAVLDHMPLGKETTLFLPSPSPTVTTDTPDMATGVVCGQLGAACCEVEGVPCEGTLVCVNGTCTNVPPVDMAVAPDLSTPPDMTSAPVDMTTSPDLQCPYDNNGGLTDKPGHGKCRL